MALLRLNTLSLQREARLASWREMVRRVCGGFEVEADDPDEFAGEIFLERLGGIECASLAGSGARIVRDRLTADCDGSGLLFYVLQLEGTSRMRQGEGEAVLCPGDATLIDGARSSEFLYSGCWRQLSLHLPARLVAGYWRRRSPATAITIAGRGYAGAVHALLARALADAAMLSAEEAALLRTQLVEGVTQLVSAGSDESGAESRLRQDDWTRVRGVLRRHLSDPDLDCTAAARLACVSTRQLQRLFQGHGLTFGGWLRRERLERCYFDLRQPPESHTTVTEVAFRWGFSDLAYFSRVFSAQFGMSPREARRLPSPVGSGGQVFGASVQAPDR